MYFGFLPLLAFLPIFGLMYVLVLFKKARAKKRRHPISGDLLRSPGESLRTEIEDITFDLSSYLTLAPVIPLMLYSGYLSLLYFDNHKPTILTIGFYVLIGLIATGYLFLIILRLSRRKNNLTLGYEAEVAVAQELNQLLREGYWVYHDFPADKFNIDHVVVGPAGVFAVETKGRTKPINSQGKADWKIEYDGKLLRFPGWTENEPIEQSKRQALWLQHWFSTCIGVNIDVKPILALPGWYIERTSRGGLLVINGKGTGNLFKQLPNPHLSQALITQIVHQLDQKCRTVKVQNY